MLGRFLSLNGLCWQLFSLHRHLVLDFVDEDPKMAISICITSVYLKFLCSLASISSTGVVFLGWLDWSQWLVAWLQPAWLGFCIHAGCGSSALPSLHLTVLIVAGLCLHDDQNHLAPLNCQQYSALGLLQDCACSGGLSQEVIYWALVWESSFPPSIVTWFCTLSNFGISHLCTLCLCTHYIPIITQCL